MSNLYVTLVPALLVLSLSACANAPLTNEEIDQTCRLLDRCSGAHPNCAVTLLADRDDVAIAGCETEWADTFRCLIAEDSCTVPASCYVAQERYTECLLHGPNEAGDWLDRYVRRDVRRDRLGCSTDCPDTFWASCPSTPADPSLDACWREAARTYPEIATYHDCLQPLQEARYACFYEIVRRSCSADTSRCDHEFDAARVTCAELSAEARDALTSCF